MSHPPFVISLEFGLSIYIKNVPSKFPYLMERGYPITKAYFVLEIPVASLRIFSEVSTS